MGRLNAGAVSIGHARARAATIMAQLVVELAHIIIPQAAVGASVNASVVERATRLALHITRVCHNTEHDTAGV